MTCFDSLVIERLTAIQLDECNRIPLVGDNPTPAVKGLEAAIQTFTRTRQVDIPADNRVKTINGGTCSKPRAAPTDRGYQVGLNFCGSNPVFESLPGYVTLDMSGSDVIGWEDRELTGTTGVALEIIFTPDADACEPGETPQCTAVLIPHLEQWVKSGDMTHNGETIPDLQMTAQTALNANLFGEYADNTELPAWLSHWAPKFDDIGTGRSWVYSYQIDCPAATVQDACTLVAI